MAEATDEEKKNDKENQLKRTKSRELRGGIMYYSCHCIKRNGLQHDCRRTGCGGEPACLVLPDPLCAPSQLARARGLADPAPLAAHLRAQGGGKEGAAESGGGSGTGKRFIVCELKGIVPDSSADKGGRCCKCQIPISKPISHIPINPNAACVCPKHPNVFTLPENAKNVQKTESSIPSMFVFDNETIKAIFKNFENKEIASDNVLRGPGGRIRKAREEVKEEICTRPGCVHWKPPSPCVWNAPCKADCFETPVNVNNQKGSRGGSGFKETALGSSTDQKLKLLMPIR